MIFESHAHYDDEAFDEDRKELLDALPAQGIGRVINVCAEVEGWNRTLDLMERYPYIYGAVGVHPDDVGALDEEKIEWMHQICQMEKTVAVGEIGLDYYWDKESHEIQKKWFVRQMDLAKEMSLPIIVHSRNAAKDTMDLMKAERADYLRGVIHCYSYSLEHAKEYMNMGYYLGIGGVVTFKNAKKLKEVVEYAPLDYLLLETDSPYLAPEPYRGKRNCSLYLNYVAEEIARIKKISYEEVVETTKKNAQELFGVK